MDAKDTPQDSADARQPPAEEKLSPMGIAAMQGDDDAVAALEKRVEALRAETEAREAAERAALEAGSPSKDGGAADQSPMEPITTLIPDPTDANHPPSHKPGYAAEKPPMVEGEPLDEKPTREGPVEQLEGRRAGGLERGG